MVSVVARRYGNQDCRLLNVPLEIVSAGLHWSRRMSKQMLPFELMFG